MAYYSYATEELVAINSNLIFLKKLQNVLIFHLPRTKFTKILNFQVASISNMAFRTILNLFPTRFIRGFNPEITNKFIKPFIIKCRNRLIKFIYRCTFCEFRKRINCDFALIFFVNKSCNK